ncbi:hypothetical protein CK228_17530 [Mesorhizobium sp. WSM4312]|nr:hypothetical protein CK228_17530 [Mesorhizobium sp. WSM4312]
MGVWANSVRIDIAVINGELSGFELKSDSDTLQRLPMQADIYSRVFDEMTLVVGSRYAEKATSIVPNWWRIIQAVEAGNAIALEVVRGGVRNPNPEPYLVAELLWKDEALAVLEEFALAKGWRGKRIKEIHERLAYELPFSVLSDRVRESLKAREGWLGKH